MDSEGRNKARKKLNPKSSLSPKQRSFLKIMQEVNFGRFEGIIVRNGELLFTPSTKILRKIKIGGNNNPRAEVVIKDFILKKEVKEALEHIMCIKNGKIRRIDFQNGLPVLLEIENDLCIRD